MPTDSNEAVKLATSFGVETFIPGGANLVGGEFGQAGLHFVAGILARAAFGVPGVLLVSANSIVKARTGRHLVEHLGLVTPRVEAAEPEVVPAAAA